MKQKKKMKEKNNLKSQAMVEVRKKGKKAVGVEELQGKENEWENPTSNITHEVSRVLSANCLNI